MAVEKLLCSGSHHIIVGRKERKDLRKRPRQDGAPGHIPRYLCLSAQPPFALHHPSICHHVTAPVSDDHGLGEISQDPPASPKSIRWQLRSPMKETMGDSSHLKNKVLCKELRCNQPGLG